MQLEHTHHLHYGKMVPKNGKTASKDGEKGDEEDGGIDSPAVVLYDCHAIRSVIPRLFTGVLPVFNIGTDDGRSCDPDLAAPIGALCDASGLSRVTDGRFKGGYITRSYGWPGDGVHAVQMELACRGYMRELPGPVGPATWPSPYDPIDASAAIATLVRVLEACLAFARNRA